MRAVIQRVAKARVLVAEEIVGRIGPGLCILLGVARTDTASDAERLADKICQLRIFEDDQGKMNRSTIESGAELLVISQFTLYGDCRKGTVLPLAMPLRQRKPSNSIKDSSSGCAGPA